MKVAEAMAQTMVAEGIDVVFSLLGEATMHVVDALSKRGIRVVDCRHEAAALAMADGYSRATGRPALCAVTTGPAFAHTLVPLTSAGRTASRVVVLTGLRNLDDLEDRQRMDHQAIARLAGVAYRPIFDPDHAVDRTRDALDFAWSSGRPVVIDVAEEVQVQDFGWDVEDRPIPDWRTPQRIHPDPGVLAKAVRLLTESERPVIIAGGGALRSDARQALLELGERTGALLATTLEAKGLFGDEPFSAGIAGLYSSDLVMAQFAEADCVVSFGASLSSHTLTKGYLFANADIVQVDVATPGPTRSGQNADCYVQADARAAAEALRNAMPEGNRTGYRTAEIAQALVSQQVDPKEIAIEPGQLDPRQVCAEIDALLPDECGFVSGLSGHFWSFGALHMPQGQSPMLGSTHVGAIGYGVPVGIGAALADPTRPLACLEGDGSAMMYINSLETAARHNVHILIIVMNNESLGAEYYKMGLKGLNPALSVAEGLDISAVAIAFGCRALTARTIADVRGFTQEFLAGSGPYVLDVRISRAVMSRTFRRAHLGEV